MLITAVLAAACRRREGRVEVTTSGAASPVRFNRDVLPVLSDHCLKCHGQDEAARKGGLRLDRRESALAGGKSGRPAIVPGKPKAGELWDRITSTDREQTMPPAGAGKPLTKAEATTLEVWIAQGAEFEPHWAFTPPSHPAAPRVRHREIVRNDLDRFVLARLESAGLEPSPAARPGVLLRRLSLDLTGLPPMVAELDQFEKDTSDLAWEREVDRLLRSPHYGERWARWWMDAARYADSDGYEKDLPRQQWAWRDWVIHALNEDMGYDQFLIRQIAGDLLPGATQDDVTATGFFRNGMVNEEGAIDAEQFRMEGLFDRIDCLGKAVLGITLQCGQCHSHKYDPLTQEEYYRLLACLNNDYEAVSKVYTPGERAVLEEIRAGVKAVEAKVRREHPGWNAELEAWGEKVLADATPWRVLPAREAVFDEMTVHPEVLPDQSVLTLGHRPTAGNMWVYAECRQTNITGIRLEALTHGDLPFGGPGRSKWGSFALTELELAYATKDATNDWKRVVLTDATADFALPDQRLQAYFRPNDRDQRRIGPAAYLVDGRDDTAWSADAGPAGRNQDREAVVQVRDGLPSEALGGTLRFTLRYKHGGTNEHGPYNNFLGRFRLSTTSAPDPKAPPVPPTALAALRKRPADRSEAERAAAFSAWMQANPALGADNEAIDLLRSRTPEGESVLTLAQRGTPYTRTTHMLERGDWLHPGGIVEAGLPRFLNPAPTNGPVTRLTLAKWMTDRRAPTTARVIVNRVWQAVFGIGLVDTPDDFGVRGSPPSHPELLDWLAVEFMDHGWSLKHLLKTICLSATYRQDSRLTPELRDRDPQNRLLARGPRFRLDAEAVRDVALSAAGLLADVPGGPSFFPPVHENFFRTSYVVPDFWTTAGAPERYRRSIYLFRRRTTPDPLLGAYDAPNGEGACVRRNRSNTPLSALASMNDQTLIEAARFMGLAMRMQGEATDDERLGLAFRRCTGRKPEKAELATLSALLRSATRHAAEGPGDPREIAFGRTDITPELPNGLTLADLAGWAVVSRALLNLDETLTKN
jgi:Protein of unknown function (DUF1553)/Protein of unknown function (DUF1549)/Planctomycete cytochrome C